MRARVLNVLVGLCWLMPCSLVLADAPRRSDRKDEQRENEAVRKAREELRDAAQEEQTAAKSLQQALSAIQAQERLLAQAIGRLQKTQEELEARHADAAGLAAARKAADEARKAYDVAGQPVRERLAATPAYQQAVAAAQTAEARLKQLAQTPDPTEVIRREQAELARTIQGPAQLERAALDAEPSLQPLRNRWKAAEESIAAARRTADRAIENDPALRTARDSIEQAKRQVADARRDAEREERQLAEVRQKRVRRQQELQQKIAADQRDSNSGNPRNNKKNK